MFVLLCVKWRDFLFLRWMQATHECKFERKDSIQSQEGKEDSHCSTGLLCRFKVTLLIVRWYCRKLGRRWKDDVKEASSSLGLDMWEGIKHAWVRVNWSNTVHSVLNLGMWSLQDKPWKSLLGLAVGRGLWF